MTSALRYAHWRLANAGNSSISAVSYIHFLSPQEVMLARLSVHTQQTSHNPDNSQRKPSNPSTLHLSFGGQNFRCVLRFELFGQPKDEFVKCNMYVWYVIDSFDVQYICPISWHSTLHCILSQPQLLKYDINMHLIYLNEGFHSAVYPVSAPVLGGGGQRSLSEDPSGARQLPQGGEGHDANTGTGIYTCVCASTVLCKARRVKHTPRFRRALI